jgi:Lon protease-like protein
LDPGRPDSAISTDQAPIRAEFTRKTPGERSRMVTSDGGHSLARESSIPAPESAFSFLRVTAERDVPLFLLPVVLFPGCAMPLHIFEPRYRAMVADCLSSDRIFGLIAREAGVDERAIEPGTVGCLAHVEQVQPLPDGRSNILVTGRSRFVLIDWAERPVPYHVGVVRLLEDESADSVRLPGLADDVRLLFARVARAARALHDDADSDPRLPADAAALSFAVAHLLDLPLAEKVRLLTSRSPRERLEILSGRLGGLVTEAETRAAVHQGAKRNGLGAPDALGT